MTVPFPNDVTFIQEGRQLEVEALDRGRRSNQIAMSSFISDGLSLGLPADDDVQETEERIHTLDQYLPYADIAFRERGLAYPFRKSEDGNSLTPVEGREDFAKKCAELSDMVGRSNAEGRLAKIFEKRAVQALHRFIGGWAVNVGSPREDGSGIWRAVERFRVMLGSDGGGYVRKTYPPAGDLGADAFWVLGRIWAGPVLYLQAKNSAFSITNMPEEFNRVSNILREWFGRSMDCRTIIRVYAVNTVLTKELKESAHLAAGNAGIHVLDAADILSAEALPPDYRDLRDSLTIM